jgi:hypothetical protein
VTLDQHNARLRLERPGEGPIVFDDPAPPPTAPRRDSGQAAAGASASPLTDYVGRYNSRAIRVEDGKLVLQRDGGPPLQMVATGKDTFTLAEVPEAQIRFTRDAGGVVTAVEILNREGQWETAPKR